MISWCTFFSSLTEHLETQDKAACPRSPHSLVFVKLTIILKDAHTHPLIQVSAQSHLTLPASELQPARLPVPGILQARTLECVAIPFSRGSSRPRDRTQASCTAGRFLTVRASRSALSFRSSSS